MMKEVFVIADNIVSPLGESSSANFQALLASRSGIEQQQRPDIWPSPFYASLIKSSSPTDEQQVNGVPGNFTRFESLLLRSILPATTNAGISLSAPDTILIISSTKGNISLIEKPSHADAAAATDVSLAGSAKKLAAALGMVNDPLVISNACISGISALITGSRMLQSGRYTNAIVAGADIISNFILSGFQSFMAISAEPCRPFDADRDGITLGEAAATMVLTSIKPAGKAIEITGGAISNDANHISGPSRTGEELAMAIQKALDEAGLQPTDIGFISAHGTATIYNDEMESKAFSLAGMESIPLNSLKGYYGHTLGAAGLVESVIAVQSLQNNVMIGTKGFSNHGVPKPVNISKTTTVLEAEHCLKTGSGFGGCNAAIIFSKKLT